MIDSLGSLMTWLAEHSVAAAWLLASLQLALMALAAGTVSRFCKRSVGLRYSTWLAAVLLALPLLPAHWLVGGWPVAIAQPGPAPESDTGLARPELDRHVAADHAHQAMRAYASSHEVEPAEETMLPQSAAGPSEDAGSAIEPAIQATGQRLPPATQASDGPVQRPLRASQIIPWLWTLLVGIYALGVFSLLLRMLTGAMRLKHLANSGRELRGDALAVLQSVAEQIGLARTPVARVCPTLSMPLTYGVRRATVLLPADFEAWPAGEQRSVLLHELAHVARRDTLGQLASKVMRAMYWFHPASWMIDRQMAVARELATDQRVLQTGISGSRYAEDLVAVIERLSLRTPVQAEPFSCAVSMSASPADFEDRVMHILQSDWAPSLASRLLQKCIIAAMLCLAIATTVRLQLVEAPAALADSPAAENAADNTADSEVADDTQAATPAGAQNAAAAGQMPTDASDFIERVRDCEVLTVSGEKHGPFITVS
ncbi:MAG: M56 family metallopeptidase, partial [Aureliella sp.]